MKHCFKCGQRLPLAAFYRHSKMADGHLNKCKECTKKDSHDNYFARHEAKRRYERERNKTPERKRRLAEYQRAYRARNPEKRAARIAVGNAVRAGLLHPGPCEVCGSVEAEAHHDDYGKPLEVRWLCFLHHRRHHGQVVAV